VAALSRFYPIPDEAIAAAGRALCRTHCELVLCDVAPMGILAARAAGISAVLIENFTWDWIYRNYSPCPPALATQADRLAAIYATVDRRLQTEPLCAPVPGCLRLPPIARRPHTTATTTRRRLGVARAQPLVLVTMGGLPEPHTFHAALQDRPEFCFVLPGSGEDIRQDGNVITLPHHSDFYHPDLVAAADVVVGKLGYSTVAEVYCAARRFLYVRRPHFPESPPMAAFVDRTITSVGISVSALRSATWLQHLDALLATPSLAPAHPNGDDAAAAAVLDGLPSRGK